MDLADKFINYAKQQTGVEISRDDYFIGDDYFCIDTKERHWLSQKLQRIERLAIVGGFRVEQNGLTRIAVFGYKPNETTKKEKGRR